MSGRDLPLVDAGGPQPEPQPRSVPECYDDVCITCSDEAVEVRIVEMLGDGLANVDTGVTIEEVDVSLVDATVGDRVLVHAKVAIGMAQA